MTHLRSVSEEVIKIFLVWWGIPTTGVHSLKKSDFSAIWWVLSEKLSDNISSVLTLKGRRKSHGDSEGSFRSQDVSGNVCGGKAIDTSNNESRSPDSVEIAGKVVIGNWLGGLDPREFSDKVFTDNFNDVL